MKKIIKIPADKFKQLWKRFNEYKKCCKALNAQIKLNNEFNKTKDV